MIALGWVDAAAFRAGNDAFYAQYLQGTLDIHAYVAFSTAPMRGRPDRSELDTARRQAYMRDIVLPNDPAGRPPALVASHRARGDRIALVSATNDFVTAPIAAAFGIATA